MWLMGRALASRAYREASQPPGDGGRVAAPPADSDSLLEFDITFYINVEPCYFPLLASFSVFTTLAGMSMASLVLELALGLMQFIGNIAGPTQSQGVGQPVLLLALPLVLRFPPAGLTALIFPARASN